MILYFYLKIKKNQVRDILVTANFKKYYFLKIYKYKSN